MRQLTLPSPVGPLTLVSNGQALVSVTFPGHTPAPRIQGTEGTDDVLALAAAELTAWFAGTRTTFTVPTARTGTDFQMSVWAALDEIPFGATTTYGALATASGKPSAARAIGAAVGRNPLSIIVPCHRVVGMTGKLTGFAGGIDTKRWLMEHEQRQLGARATQTRLPL